MNILLQVHKNYRKQGNMIFSKEHKQILTESKDKKIEEFPEKG